MVTPFRMGRPKPAAPAEPPTPEAAVPAQAVPELSTVAQLDAEETIAMPALQEQCGGEELQRIWHAFQASRTPEQRMTDLQRMFPALPPAARAFIARQILGAGFIAVGKNGLTPPM